MSAAVEALTRVLLQHEIDHLDDPDPETNVEFVDVMRGTAVAILDALAELLASETEAGDALRWRLGMVTAVREGRAKALKETAEKWQYEGWSDVLVPMPTEGVPALAVGQRVTDWLRARAAMEAGR